MNQNSIEAEAPQPTLSQCQSLILSQKNSIVLKQTVKKISYFLPAYQNTYVFIRVDIPGSAESIVHINSDGQILYQYSCNRLIGQFEMFNPNEVIVANTSSKKIDIIHLEQQVVKSFKHQFMLQDAHQIKIMTFYHSKLFAIVQIDSTHFKLTYYRYQRTEIDLKPVSLYLGGKQDWSFDHHIVKVNNYSKIAWFSKTKQSEVIEIRTWDVQSNPKGSRSVIVINNTFRIDQNSFFFYIHNLWQNQQDIYTLVVSSSRSIQINQQDLVQQFNHSQFIIDVRKNTIRKATYLLVGNGTIWNDNLDDYFPLQEYTAFIAYNSSDINSTPIFYIDNRTQKIIMTNERKYNKNIKYYRPGYEPYSFIEVQYENSNVKKIEMTVIRIANKKQILLHFMLHLNEDFNHDLLQDAIQLLQ